MNLHFMTAVQNFRCKIRLAARFAAGNGDASAGFPVKRNIFGKITHDLIHGNHSPADAQCTGKARFDAPETGSTERSFNAVPAIGELVRFAEPQAPPASHTFRFVEKELWTGRNGLRIMTPEATHLTSLEEYHTPQARAVMHRRMLNFRNDSVHENRSFEEPTYQRSEAVSRKRQGEEGKSDFVQCFFNDGLVDAPIDRNGCRRTSSVLRSSIRARSASTVW